MNPNLFDENERRTPFPGPNAPRQRQHYKFTADELRVLKECNRESFFQRCLPLSALLGGATYYAVKTGTLAPNLRFGATPKVMAAVAVGYFVGKFSYQGKCAEKLMQLPNSPLGQMIRARKEGRLPEGTESGFGPSVSLSPFSGITDSYSDISPGSQDIDLDRPQLDGLDDSFRPSVDNPIVIQEEEMPPEQKHVTTYEELRKKNREEYEQKRLSSYRESPKESRQLPATVPSTEAREEFPKSARRNKYGDIME